MSMQKEKSLLSNLQVVSEKEVAFSLEKLINSVVAEVTAHSSALQPQQVTEPNDDAFHINSLPDEIMLEVFGYLTQNQLSQIARVCRRWNVLTKSPGLWRKVDVKIFPSCISQTDKVKSFIHRLPSCATSIRLNFTKCRNQIVTLKYEELCIKLEEKCPHLKELILIKSELSNSLSSVVGLCSQFLQNLKDLVFHRCLFSGYSAKEEFCGTSRIAFLDLSWCAFKDGFLTEFSTMPDLKVLYLCGYDDYNRWFLHDASFLNQLQVLNMGYSGIISKDFLAIQNNGLNLKELYLCSIDLQDHDLTFNNSVFPHLKTICLCCPYLTYVGVLSLIQSCPSLQNVYVDEDVAESFAIANRCKSRIVKVINWYHRHNTELLQI